jgi:hypothetical protein
VSVFQVPVSGYDGARAASVPRPAMDRARGRRRRCGRGFWRAQGVAGGFGGFERRKVRRICAFDLYRHRARIRGLVRRRHGGRRHYGVQADVPHRWPSRGRHRRDARVGPQRAGGRRARKEVNCAAYGAAHERPTRHLADNLAFSHRNAPRRRPGPGRMLSAPTRSGRVGSCRSLRRNTDAGLRRKNCTRGWRHLPPGSGTGSELSFSIRRQSGLPGSRIGRQARIGAGRVGRRRWPRPSRTGAPTIPCGASASSPPSCALGDLAPTAYLKSISSGDHSASHRS